MGISDNFYLKRRSVMARKMSPEPIKESDLNQIIQAGIRVPDHGALNYTTPDPPTRALRLGSMSTAVTPNSRKIRKIRPLKEK